MQSFRFFCMVFMCLPPVPQRKLDYCPLDALSVRFTTDFCCPFSVALTDSPLNCFKINPKLRKAIVVMAMNALIKFRPCLGACATYIFYRLFRLLIMLIPLHELSIILKNVRGENVRFLLSSMSVRQWISLGPSLTRSSLSWWILPIQVSIYTDLRLVTSIDKCLVKNKTWEPYINLPLNCSLGWDEF